MDTSAQEVRQNVEPLSNEYVKIWVKDGILHGIYTVKELDLEVAKICLDLRYAVNQGVSYPSLVDIRSIKSTTKAARDLLASEQGYRYIKTCSLIIDSSVNKYIGNFFLKISKPVAPTRLFTDEVKALDWLMQFKDQ